MGIDPATGPITSALNRRETTLRLLSHGVLADVYYDSTNANGSLGSSRSTSNNALNTAEAHGGTFVYNGYLYAVGGRFVREGADG